MESSFKFIDEDPLRPLYIQLLQLSPIGVVPLVMWPTNDAMSTLLSFHVFCMVAFPLIYCYYYRIDIKALVSIHNTNVKKQIQIGTILGTLGLLGMFLAFQLYIHLFGKHILIKAKIPVQFNWYYLSIFSFNLSIINPILEELFWRIVLEHGAEKTEPARWIGALNYGLYHFFVLDYVIKDALLALILMFCVVILGRIMTYIKDNYGLYCAIIAHAGVDAGLCAILFETSLYFMK